MIKVIPSRSLLEYRQAMANLVNEVREKPVIRGVTPGRVLKPASARKEIPGICMPGLLKPPGIDVLDPAISLSEGRLDGIISINTSDDFGVVNVCVIINDEQGNPIESGYAINAEIYEDAWGYFPSAPLASGASVRVQVIASDALGGTTVKSRSITVR